MSAVTLERTTRRLVRLWTAAAATLALVPTVVVVAAGGATQWVRWLLGAVTVSGIVAATRYRISLRPGVWAGVAMIAAVPHDAAIDRGLVAAVGGIALVLAAEAAHVARRLVTLAPVRSTRLDAAALAQLAASAAIVLAVTAGVAQLDRWGNRFLVAGLAIAGVGFVVALTGSRPRPTSAE